MEQQACLYSAQDRTHYMSSLTTS
uniref:Uncharacterized protein n=1 Tax=Rhizophora mucronata TaxID=61149 RepID=A0A2P2N3Z0_RHIMU